MLAPPSVNPQSLCRLSCVLTHVIAARCGIALQGRASGEDRGGGGRGCGPADAGVARRERLPRTGTCTSFLSSFSSCSRRRTQARLWSPRLSRSSQVLARERTALVRARWRSRRAQVPHRCRYPFSNGCGPALRARAPNASAMARERLASFIKPASAGTWMAREHGTTAEVASRALPQTRPRSPMRQLLRPTR